MTGGTRLIWTKQGDGKGFLARPDADHPDRYAEIWHVSAPYAPGLHWAWVVKWGRARTAGGSATVQEASDACNDAWPAVEADGRRLAEENRELDDLMARVDEAAKTGTADIEAFALAEMDGDLLLTLIWRCRNLWEPAFRSKQALPGIEALMAAASAELHRRRMGGQPAGTWTGPRHAVHRLT